MVGDRQRSADERESSRGETRERIRVGDADDDEDSDGGDEYGVVDEDEMRRLPREGTITYNVEFERVFEGDEVLGGGGDEMLLLVGGRRLRDALNNKALVGERAIELKGIRTRAEGRERMAGWEEKGRGERVVPDIRA